MQQVQEAGAAGGDDVLTVVHRFPGGGIHEGESPAAQEPAGLHQSYRKPGFQQVQGRGNPGDAAAKDHYAGLERRRFSWLTSHVWAVTRTFSILLRLTR